MACGIFTERKPFQVQFQFFSIYTYFTPSIHFEIIYKRLSNLRTSSWGSYSVKKKHRKSAKLPWRHNIKLSFCSLSFCLLVFLSFCIFVFSSFCLFVFLSFCLFVFLSFCLSVFLSRHHSDQMSEGSEVSKVTLCVKVLKWHPLSHWLTHSPRSGIELPGQLKI